MHFCCGKSGGVVLWVWLFFLGMYSNLPFVWVVVVYIQNLELLLDVGCEAEVDTNLPIRMRRADGGLMGIISG